MENNFRSKDIRGIDDWLIKEQLQKDIENLKTTHLTIEQIEAEGWTKSSAWKPKGYTEAFEKGRYGLFLSENDSIIIYDDDEYDPWYQSGRIYNGQCKDLNTFRYICKLLGI